MPHRRSSLGRHFRSQYNHLSTHSRHARKATGPQVTPFSRGTPANQISPNDLESGEPWQSQPVFKAARPNPDLTIANTATESIQALQLACAQPTRIPLGEIGSVHPSVRRLRRGRPGVRRRIASHSGSGCPRAAHRFAQLISQLTDALEQPQPAAAGSDGEEQPQRHVDQGHHDPQEGDQRKHHGVGAGGGIEQHHVCRRIKGRFQGLAEQVVHQWR